MEGNGERSGRVSEFISHPNIYIILYDGKDVQFLEIHLGQTNAYNIYENTGSLTSLPGE
jgi:hypothetical protein